MSNTEDPRLGVGSSFSRGFSRPLKAFAFLMSSRGVKRYAILPLAFSCIVYFAVLILFFYLIWNWRPEFAWDFWGPTGAWLAKGANYGFATMKWIVLPPVVLVICYFTFTTLGMVMAAPLNDLLSEKVERIVCNRDGSSIPLRYSIQGSALSIIDSLWILFRQGLLTLFVLPLLAIPIVGFLPLFLVTAYYTGLGFMDTGMARNFLRIRHKRPVIRSRKWEILGMGMAMELLFLIPFVGLLMLPVGVTAGTMLYCDCDWMRAFEDYELDIPMAFRPPIPTAPRA